MQCQCNTSVLPVLCQWCTSHTTSLKQDNWKVVVVYMSSRCMCKTFKLSWQCHYNVTTMKVQCQWPILFKTSWQLPISKGTLLTENNVFNFNRTDKVQTHCAELWMHISCCMGMQLTMSYFLWMTYAWHFVYKTLSKYTCQLFLHICTLLMQIDE